MRVLHITSGDLWGGAESQLYGLVRALRQSDDMAVSVLSFNDALTARRLRELGVSVTVLSEAGHSLIGLLWRMVSFLRQTRPDIVHTHGYKECVLGTAAAFLVGGMACVRTVHGWVEVRARCWQLKRLLVRFIELLSLRFQRAVVGVSEELGGRLARYVSRTNVVIIENGIEVANRPEARSSLRSASPRIAVIARMVPVKRIDLFLDVCRLLKDKYGGKIGFIVIGDGPAMPQVRSRIHALGLADQMELPGFVGNVSAYLDKIDVLLITSDHEGLPMTLLEAMAHRVPVVANAVGGIPVVLEDGRSGWLVRRQAPEDYFQAVQQVIEEKGEAQRRVASAYARVVSRYSVSQMASKYKELYRCIRGDAGKSPIPKQEGD